MAIRLEFSDPAGARSEELSIADVIGMLLPDGAGLCCHAPAAATVDALASPVLCRVVDEEQVHRPLESVGLTCGPPPREVAIEAWGHPVGNQELPPRGGVASTDERAHLRNPPGHSAPLKSKRSISSLARRVLHRGYPCQEP